MLTNKTPSTTEAETILEELISSAINKRILCRQDWIGLSSFAHKVLHGSKNSSRIENGLSTGLLLKSRYLKKGAKTDCVLTLLRKF